MRCGEDEWVGATGRQLGLVSNISFIKRSLWVYSLATKKIISIACFNHFWFLWWRVLAQEGKGNRGVRDRIEVLGPSSPPSAAHGFNRYLDNIHTEQLTVKMLEKTPVDEGWSAQAKAPSKHVMFPFLFLNTCTLLWVGSLHLLLQGACRPISFLTFFFHRIIRIGKDHWDNLIQPSIGDSD